MSGSFLEVKDLSTQFRTPEGTVHAVNGVSFSLEESETLGIVGESGCGKSVTMLLLLRLIRGDILSVKERDYVMATKVIGARDG